MTSAQYSASYAYDTLGRLTSAPLGGYTCGDPNHLDAATSVGTTYSASYDAAGDMTCRAPTNTVTCAGTPTGSVLTYDNERRLATWQNTPSSPTSTAAYWYDGEGQRVAQTLNGVTTYYIGSDEEITGGTLLKYNHIPGLPVLGAIIGNLPFVNVVGTDAEPDDVDVARMRRVPITKQRSPIRCPVKLEHAFVSFKSLNA